MTGSDPQPGARSGGVETDRPWVGHYQRGVPPEIAIPEITLPEMLAQTTSRYGNHIFATFFGRNYTYREIDDDSNRFANRLMELGLVADEPVLVVLPNSPQFLVAAYGILKAGGVIAAVNPLLTGTEIRTLAEDSGANIVVTLDRFWDAIEPLLDSKQVHSAIVTGVQDGLSTLKRLLYPLKYRDEMVSVPHDPARNRYQFRKLMKGAQKARPVIAREPDDMAVFQYTGGTTGIPKAVVLSHRNLIANAHQIGAWIADTEEGEETVLAILPFFHAYGGTLCLYLCVHLAARVLLVPRFDVKSVMDDIKKYQPTILPGVPTLYNALNSAAQNSPERQQAMRSIRYCISGGAPLSSNIRDRFEEITGASLVEGYGLSEASPVTHINPLDGRARPGSIGLPISNTEAKLVDPETGDRAAHGQAGELCIRGPQVMQGYWNRPAETAEVLDGERWLHTGDIATVDEDGYFYIVDRLKDVIITSGENIYPTEVENVLASHPKIHEVAVAGVPHPSGGEIAKAYIVLHDGETLDQREIRQFCADRLARYKVPRRVEFRSELPKSAVGKVLRRQLEESIAENGDDQSP